MIKIIKRLLNNQSISMKDLNIFIVKYVESKGFKTPTVEQINKIGGLLRNGIFNIKYAAKEFSDYLGYTVITTEWINPQQIIRIDVYE